nr:ankyrin repeat-containing protein [Tanacetum cinerariifolium]
MKTVLQTILNLKGPGNENRSNHHGVDYQMRKLKMPLFDGEDSHGWIYMVERHFEVQDIQPREQLRAAVLCMEGQALSWFRWSVARSPFRSCLFETLAGRLAGLPKEVMKGTFIKGLRPELRSAVRVMQPEGLNHTMKIAIMIDDNKLNGVVGKSALKPPTGGYNVGRIYNESGSTRWSVNNSERKPSSATTGRLKPFMF